MVNALTQHSPQSVTRSSERESDEQKLDSPQGTWSGGESGGEGGGVDNHGTKRKRPMSVSYVDPVHQLLEDQHCLGVANWQLAC